MASPNTIDIALLNTGVVPNESGQGASMYDYADKPNKPQRPPDVPQAPVDDTAARMYANADSPSKPQPLATVEKSAAEQHQPPVPAKEPEWAPMAGSTSVAELVGRELSDGEQMYEEAGQIGDSPEAYGVALHSVFEPLEFSLRHDGNKEDEAAVIAGRKEAAAVFHEQGIPIKAATDLTRQLAIWFDQPDADEGLLLDAKGRAADELEALWGKDAHARIQLAQRTAEAACKRLPWLGDLLAKGAGNDPKVIKHLADIGLRNARKAKR